MQIDVVMRRVFCAGGLLTALLVVSGCAAGGSKIEGTIGVVDPTRVLNETNAGKKAKDSLGAFSKNRQALIEMDEKELRRMEEDFVKQASVLSPAAKKEREDQFRRRMAEYQQKAAEMNREVQEKQKDVLEGFREKVGPSWARWRSAMDCRSSSIKGKAAPLYTAMRGSILPAKSSKSSIESTRKRAEGPLPGTTEEASRCNGRISRAYSVRSGYGWRWSSPALSDETFKVAVMDQQLVIEQSKAGKRALEELKAYSMTRQKIINADDQELKELQQAIQDGKLTEARSRRSKSQFQAKLDAYQRRLAEFNREIQQKQREMVAEYMKKVQAAAQAVGRKKRICCDHRQGERDDDEDRALSSAVVGFDRPSGEGVRSAE